MADLTELKNDLDFLKEMKVMLEEARYIQLEQMIEDWIDIIEESFNEPIDKPLNSTENEK